MSPQNDDKAQSTELQSCHGVWISDDSGPSCLFIESAEFDEQTVKIYEDFLSDLGIASLHCRCRHGVKGFELRLRWFPSVRHYLQNSFQYICQI